MPDYYRYAEDPTGTNPDNHVSSEYHTLSELPIKVVVPKYGPFFTESLIVLDGLTLLPLVKNVDYRVPVINQEISLKYAKEIGDAILIEKADVAPTVRISYNCVGGVFQNQITNIVTMYEQWLNDNRPVDWTTGVYGKPAEFPPSAHSTWMTDIFGYETFNYCLERIAQAIMAGCTPAYDQLIYELERRIVTEEEIDMGELSRRLMSLERHIYALKKYNYNTFLVTFNRFLHRKGQKVIMDVKVTNWTENEPVYWRIIHYVRNPANPSDPNNSPTTDAYFELLSGFFIPVHENAHVEIKTLKVKEGNPLPLDFRITLHRNSPDGFLLYTSPIHQIRKSKALNDGNPWYMASQHCYYSPKVKRKARTKLIHDGYWNTVRT